MSVVISRTWKIGATAIPMVSAASGLILGLGMHVSFMPTIKEAVPVGKLGHLSLCAARLANCYQWNQDNSIKYREFLFFN